MNHLPGESSAWWITCLVNHLPGESSAWWITCMVNHLPGESSAWWITCLTTCGLLYNLTYITDFKDNLDLTYKHYLRNDLQFSWVDSRFCHREGWTRPVLWTRRGILVCYILVDAPFAKIHRMSNRMQLFFIDCYSHLNVYFWVIAQFDFFIVMWFISFFLVAP